MESTDAELIVGSLEEPVLFSAVFDRHNRAVHAYLVRRVGYSLAEDLFGEVWLRALRSRNGYDPSWPDARPWLYGIAHNTVRSFWRHRHGEHRPPPEPAHDPWPDVDDRLDAARRLGALRDVLSSLDDADRDVLLLVAWEQLTPTEVGVVLRMPAGTVRWRLHRARECLRVASGSSSSLPSGSEA